MRVVLQAMAMLAVLMLTAVSGPATAQDTTSEPAAEAADPRASTGGAQTLEDILRRQRGEPVDNSFRRDATGDPDSAAGMVNQLGTLGGTSDSEVYRALRFGTADVTVSTNSPAAEVLIQDRGMWWLQFREGPLMTYGGYLLLAMFGILALFYLLRGKIRIDGEKTGETILRFNAIERFSHWLLATSFILLGITGLITLFGRKGLIPLMGKDGYATLALYSKWVHNNVSWAFMLALVMIFVFWVVHNFPARHDINWLLKAGGLFSKHSHPPAKKFNAGQKFIFWSCILLGGSISASGLALLFPFELNMFAATFAKLNDLGVPGLLGVAPFPTELAPHEEMQFAQLWHAIVSFLLMAIIIGHIYIGSVGMEGAFDAMGSGHVEKQWAREHHGLWVKEVEEKAAAEGKPTPAE